MGISKSVSLLLLLIFFSLYTCTVTNISKAVPTKTESIITKKGGLEEKVEKTTLLTKGNNTESNVGKNVRDNTAGEGNGGNSDRRSEFDELNFNDFEKAINYVRYELTNHSASPYKEQIDDVMSVTKERLRDGELYHMKFRLTASDCKRDNASCDPYFDTAFMPSKKTQIIAPLDSPLKPGKAIAVHGLIPMLSKEFHITIQTGYETPASAQLRLKVKFQRTGTVIELHYFEGGQWNLYNHYKGFLEPKKRFHLLIMCMSAKFKIYINGNSLASFSHKLHFEDATHLSIFGDVSVTNITGVGAYLPVHNVHPIKSWTEDDIQYQTFVYVPFVAPLAAPLQPGKSIHVRGFIPNYSEKFAITIQTGSDFEPERAQFRLLANFKDGKSKLSFLYFDGTWKDEEFADSTLKSGRSFHIRVTCRANSFKISIDNKDIAKYEYRLPYTSATHLSVVGMVNVSEVVGISELPYVKFLDKPKFSPYSVPFKNVTLSPGQKTRIWAYILENATDFWINLQDQSDSVNYFHIHVYFLKKEAPYYSFNTHQNHVWGKKVDIKYPTWLKRGQPIQMEISCLEKFYKITFHGLWTHNFDYRMALNKTALLYFDKPGLAIYGVDGVSAEPVPRPPPPPPPPSRLCGVKLWSLPVQEEMWFRDFVCETG